MKTAIKSTTVAVFGLAVTANAAHIWINEFHYDNPGGDVGEFVEIALSTPNMSGFGPSDYAVEFYNGSNGNLYGSTNTLDNADSITAFPVLNSMNTITLYSFNFAGIQNGAPDGIALVNVTNGTVESFLSYEGMFTADADAMGIAGGLGLTSTPIGATEPGVGNMTSLSAIGTGMNADAFGAGSFVLTEMATPGAINTGQTFSAPRIPPSNNVPDGGSTLSILGLAVLGLGVARRKLAGRA